MEDKLNVYDSKTENIQYLFEDSKHMGFIISEIKDDGNVFIRYFSPGAENILGYQEKEVINKHASIFHPSKDIKMIKKMCNKIKNKESWQQEIKLLSKNKGKIPVMLSLYPYEFDDNKYRALAVIIEISELFETKEKLNSILNNVKNAVWSLNWPDLTPRYISPSIKNIYGYSKNDFINNPELWEKLVHPEDKNMIEKVTKELKEKGTAHNEMRIIKKDGTIVWTEDILKFVYDNQGNPIRLEGIVRDITEKKRAEKELNFQLEFEQLTSEISKNFVKLPNSEFYDGVDFALKRMGEFFEVDRSYLFIFSENGTILNNTNEWCAEGINPEIDNLQDLPSSAFTWWTDNLIEKGQLHIADVSALPESASEEKATLEAQEIKSLLVTPIFQQDQLFGFMGLDSVKEKRHFTEKHIDLLEILTNIISNAYKKYLDYKMIKHMNSHDNLTGLFARKNFIEITKEYESENCLPIGIIIADINGLKLINNSYGHNRGDEIIAQTAEMLQTTMRKKDIIGRWGGDEFIILLPKTKRIEVEFLARQLQTLETPLQFGDIKLSLSTGSAVRTSMDQDIKDVIKEADQALYYDQLTQSQSTKNKIVQSLLSTLRAKSDETEKHSLRMEKLAQELGRKAGVNNEELNHLAILANIHDIGKITIPEKILNKPGRLNDEEWELLKTHPLKGAEIAASTEEFAPVAKHIFSHHEHYDGSGYPRGLKGKEIPLLARILSIVDAYDVMINERPYKEAMSIKEAIEELKRCSGSQFDPILVELFLEIIEKEKSDEKNEKVNTRDETENNKNLTDDKVLN